MKKHIILTKLFEFGGSNTHLGTMIRYFGSENVFLIVEDELQLPFLKNIADGDRVRVLVLPKLHKFAHLTYPSILSNCRELLKVIRSVFYCLWLSIQFDAAEFTICVVEPEKYLYLMWIPFVRVNYILHTAPHKKYTTFTSFTSNFKLSRRKNIITVSKANKKLICKNWDISSKKEQFINVVYNCVAVGLLNSVPFNAQAEDKRLIVTSGHVAEYKNPALWLEVAKRVTAENNDLHFVWLGNGPLLDDFRKITENTGNITFEGKVDDVNVYLERAIIYYQPSLYETHGIAVLEAMANALPCVVSNTGGLPESIDDRQNGLLVDPVDTEEHVGALIYLAKHPELRQNYGKNAREKCVSLFGFDAFKSNMDRIYFKHQLDRP